VFSQRISLIVDTVYRYLWIYSSVCATCCGPRFETEAVWTCNLIYLYFFLLFDI